MSGLAFVGGECAEIWGGLGRVGLVIGRLGNGWEWRIERFKVGTGGLTWLGV